MLYIHKLADFGQKIVESESIAIIRDFKQKLKFPFKVDAMQSYLQQYHIQAEEINLAERTVELCEETAKKVEELLALQDSSLEMINLQRTVQMLRSIPVPMQESLMYNLSIKNSHSKIVEEFTQALNNVANAYSKEQKIAVNEALNRPFEKLLRNKSFVFRHNDIIHEGQVTMLEGLLESIGRGYFFNFTLEEEIQKASLNDIRHRLAPEKLAVMDEVVRNIEEIKKCVDQAYALNFRMVEMCTTMYAFIKAVNTKMV